jgi:hypothetical protein
MTYQGIIGKDNIKMIRKQKLKIQQRIFVSSDMDILDLSANAIATFLMDTASCQDSQLCRENNQSWGGSIQ